METTPVPGAGTLDILLDVDGVIYPFPELFTPWLSVRLQRELELDTSVWEFYLQWGLCYEDFVAHLTEGVHEQQLWWTGDPYPDVPAAFAALRGEGHRLHLVTARDVAGAHAGLAATWHWLEQNDLTVETVSLAQDKPVVLDRLGLDPARCVAVDDGAHHVEAWEQAGVYGVVMNRWGTYGGDHRNVPDLANFAEHLATLPRAS